VAGVTATATLSALLVRRRNSGTAFDFQERKFRIKALIGMNWIHISDDDLERYYWAEAARDYVDVMRVALLRISD
jgi:hypothetical protein